jgi:glycosyltransferase involved in cell wall biosynthesis
MRVLHAINSLATGGAEILLEQICRGQKLSGLHPSVFVFQPHPGKLESDFIRAGIPIHLSSCRQFAGVGHVISLAQHLRKHKYDVIHSHLFPSQLWVALAALLVPGLCPMVTTEHSTWTRRRKPLVRLRDYWMYLPRMIDKWMYGRYRAIICISEAVRAIMVAWVDPYKYEFAVVPNGIDLSRFSALSPQRFTETTDLVILSVGSLCYRKDYPTLLRALARVQQGNLVIVGDGQLRDSLRKLCVELNITGRVRFSGRRDDVLALMASADIYVQSSQIEGFGVAVLEAMAAGLPVIASDAPGMREVVHGAAVMFPVGDSDALAARICELICSRPYREKLSAASRQRASLFSIAQTVNRYKALYDAVLSQSPIPSFQPSENIARTKVEVL